MFNRKWDTVQLEEKIKALEERLEKIEDAGMFDIRTLRPLEERLVRGYESYLLGAEREAYIKEHYLVSGKEVLTHLAIKMGLKIEKVPATPPYTKFMYPTDSASKDASHT